MKDMIAKLFPEGQRKLMVSLVALAIAIAFEKGTKQGLSEDMKTSLIAIVAIFTGGNVMEHMANALKVFRGTKIGGIIEDVLPGDQGLRVEEPQKEEVAAAPDFTEHIKELYSHAQTVNGRLKAMEDSAKLQAENTQRLITMINNRGEGRNG